MKRGLRYLPAPRRGRRRAAVAGFGVLAALSLVWQQQATLASFTDSEFAGATFTSAKLPVITPTTSAGVDSIDVAWPKAVRADGNNYNVSPSYTLNWSPDGTGSGTNLTTGAYASPFSHATGTDKPADKSLVFTDVSSGNQHSCGIARGTVYCWGTSSTGALGGASSPARTPTKVSGLSGIATAVSVGTDFSCAIVAGAAYCWGEGTNGQLGAIGDSPTPKLIGGLSGKAVTAISAGGMHACVLADGLAYCWGYDASGQLGDNSTLATRTTATPVAASGVLAGRTIAGISAGANHTCVVADGQAFCWGQNTYYQLGDGSNTTTNQPTPLAVSASGELLGRTVSAIAAGGSHTCSIADAKVYCWGQNSASQLGNGTTTQAKVPTPTAIGWAAGSKPTQIATGSLHSCALVDDGKAYCWGSSFNSVPTVVTGLAAGKAIASISVGNSFGCAVVSGSPAACVGENGAYQLGNGTQSSLPSFTDVLLTGLGCPDKSVRTSDKTCSLKEGTSYQYQLDYSVGSWDASASEWIAATTLTRGVVDPRKDTAPKGSITLIWDAAPKPGAAYPEYQLQRSLLPDGSNPRTLTVTGARSWTDTGGFAPTRRFTEISAGASHTCGIVGGDLYCWGLNSSGQLGLGLNDTTSRTVPTEVGGLLANKTVTAVSVGASHTCAVADAAVYCWGSNNASQLGNGGTAQQNVPVAVTATGVLQGKTVTAVSAGTSHTCVVASGKAYCWGANDSGQLGDNSVVNRATPVAVNAAGSLLNRTVTDIAAGASHTCAVASGAAYCWGSDSDDQLGNGFGSSIRTTPAIVTATGVLLNKTVTQVSAGDKHSCVVANKRAYCWGSDVNGQLGNDTTTGGTSNVPVAVYAGAMTTDVTMVSAGAGSSCAAAGSRAYCWGANGSGQLGNGSATPSGVPVAVTPVGALLNAATVSGVAAGGTHACAVVDGAALCWGNPTNGRLGNRAVTGTWYRPALVVGDARCATGSVNLGDGTCSLVSGATYFYNITYTLDGALKKVGSWPGLAAG